MSKDNPTPLPLTKEAALKKLQLFLDNKLNEYAIKTAKQYDLLDALPDALRATLEPQRKAVAGQVDYSINTGIWLSKLISNDPRIVELKKEVRILAPLDKPVLIMGESGTGKEIIAHALHDGRNPETFIDINCAGLPEYLIESELFGHNKGAFTGADCNKTGLMRTAQDGTLFLDEIGDMPLPLQAKLLRAIQDRRVRPVGSNKYESINCRVVSATHHNLAELVRQKLFREDLYERISTFELHTIPIRERMSDVPLIIKTLDPDGKFPLDKIDEEWIAQNTGGNYRSMQKLVERYLVLGKLPNNIKPA